METPTCPICPPRTTPSGKIRGITLDIVETNVSGCDFDLAECRQCGKTFSITYKIDKIEEY